MQIFGVDCMGADNSLKTVCYNIPTLLSVELLVRRFLRALTLLLALGCSASGLGAEKKPILVASLPALSLIATDLAGDWLEVRPLLKTNQDPHHVALSVSQRRLINDAAFILWVGPSLENYLVQGVRARDAGSSLGMEEFVRKHFPQTDTQGDAHLWLHPGMVRRLYQQLAVMLGEKYPHKEESIHLRLERALEILDKKVAIIAAGFEKLNASNNSVIVDHHAYGYFTDYFNVAVAGALVDARGVAIGARSLAALEKVSTASCLVVERLPAPRRAQRLAKSQGLRLVAIDPLGADVVVEKGYGGLLDSLSSGFIRCLSSTALE